MHHDYNHIDNSRCISCNALCEDPAHYFLLCPAYEIPHADFLDEICQILHENNVEVDFNSNLFVSAFIDMILNGTELLNGTSNSDIFKITQTFITNSDRFR